jgi:hypothetical protein
MRISELKYKPECYYKYKPGIYFRFKDRRMTLVGRITRRILKDCTVTPIIGSPRYRTYVKFFYDPIIILGDEHNSKSFWQDSIICDMAKVYKDKDELMIEEL